LVEYIKRDKNDIYGKPILGFFFKNQKFITTFKIILTAVFFYALYFGFTHQGKENTFTTALFWGIFWSFFMVLTLPTFGRIFCGICPHGFMGKYITRFGLKKKMPKWMQNRYIGIFLLVVGWWGVYYMFPGIYKTPFGTAMMFTVMTLISFVIYFLYRDMSYCKYICPIGTLTRAYSKLSFTWLGTYQSACSECKTFDCATACPYNLKPFTFDKRNSMTDCTLCMECSTACEAVSFKFVKPSGTLFKKFQVLKAEVWTYILILGSIPIAMAFHHGIGRSNVGDEMIWAKTAHFFEQFINFGPVDSVGLFAFLYALLFTALAAVVGMFIAAKILKQDFKKIFYDLGYAYAPLFILGSLAHTLESFFTRGYDRIVEGFALGFGFGVVDIAPLAKRGESWLMIFGILKWVAILWALLILYKRMKLIDAPKAKKILAYPFAASLIIFFLSVNIYRAHIIDTYGRKARSHGGMHSTHAMGASHAKRGHKAAAPWVEVTPDTTLFFTQKKPSLKKGSGGNYMMHRRQPGEIPSRKLYLVTGDLQKPECVANVDGEFIGRDVDNKPLKLEIKKEGKCTSVKFFMPKSGYYTLYYLQEKKSTTNVTKYEFKRFDHSSDEEYNKEKMSAKSIEEVPFDILRLRADDETFYSRPQSGERLRFLVLKDAKPLAKATLTLTTEFGWQKVLYTDKDGIAEVQLIKDYLPEWDNFNKRFREKFLVTATFSQSDDKYKASYTGEFMPSRSEYQSYAYGLIITLVLLVVLSVGVYLYRMRVQKPFKEVTFDD